MEEYQAGHKLNTEIARQVFGVDAWVRTFDGGASGAYQRREDDTDLVRAVPRYSEDIEASLYIMHWLHTQGVTIEINLWATALPAVSINLRGKVSDDIQERGIGRLLVGADAETVPLALCRVALRFVELLKGGPIE